MRTEGRPDREVWGGGSMLTLLVHCKVLLTRAVSSLLPEAQRCSNYVSGWDMTGSILIINLKCALSVGMEEG
jgi:hypothetical protein